MLTWRHGRDMAKPSERRQMVVEFARRLVLSMEALGYSNKSEFGRTIRANRNRLQHWLTAGSIPEIEVIKDLDAVHGLSPDWLFLGRMSGLRSDLKEKIQEASAKRGLVNGKASLGLPQDPK